MDVDDFSSLIVKQDVVGIEGARDHVTPDVLEDLVWLYWRLGTWLQKCLLVQLLQDWWEPELYAPVMLDVLRAPTDWHDLGSRDTVHWAQAVALGFLDERYDRFDHHWNDRAALRAAVEEVRRERGLVADVVADEPKPVPPYSGDPVARLEEACVRGDTDTVLATLDTGLDVDTPLSLGTPMMHAVINGNLETALRLLERGASVRARWKYTQATVLIKAATYGEIALAEAALARGAEVDETDDSGMTALYHAADCGALDVVRRLLRAGATPAASERSAFVAAAASGHVEVADVLLDAGCGLEEVSSSGNTALGVAALVNEAAAVDFLIAKGAHVDSRDRDGRTPLMHAARGGYPGVVERLLRAGADPAATDNAGKTALQLVRRHRKAEVTAALTPPPAPVPEPRPGKRPWTGEVLGLKLAYDEGRPTRGGWPCVADCPGTTTLLVAVDLRGVPHRATGHRVMYDYTFLAECTTCGIGRLESFSHDCWNDHEDEPWDLAWVRTVVPEGVARLRVALRDCPQPENYRCDCAVHAALKDSKAIGTDATSATVELVDGVARFRPC